MFGCSYHTAEEVELELQLMGNCANVILSPVLYRGRIYYSKQIEVFQIFDELSGIKQSVELA